MRIAITGGTGFVGRHLARSLVAAGHEVALVARGEGRRDPATFGLPGVRFFQSDLGDASELARAFSACGAVAHCAGINREIGRQTYQRVHIEGTQHVVEAARKAGVSKVVFLSFLRARPNCGSGYHESKWAAEEIIRASGVDHTILKAGVIYGRGDHMLDHLSHALHTFPVFATVGLKDQRVRPLAIDDLVLILKAAVLGGQLSRQTLAVTGPEEMFLSDAVKRVACVIGKSPLFVRMPLWFHYMLGHALEAVMKVPLVSVAQVRILSEGIVEPLPVCDAPPAPLLPGTPFSPEQIRRGLPDAAGFGLADLRCCSWRR